MAGSVPTRQPSGAERRVLWLALGSIVLYFVALTVFNNQPIADEMHHLRAVQWFADGHWRLPDFLPMLPGYHLLVSLPVRLLGDELAVIRALNTLMAVAAVVLVRGVLRRLDPDGSPEALLLFAWNPLLFSFMPLVYTDLAALFFLVAAVYFHVRGWFALSALPLLVACLMRQSNVVWVAFMAAWAVVALWEGRPLSWGSFMRAAASRVWAHVSLGVVAAAFVFINGGVTVGGVRLNRPAVNVAQFYLFALIVALVWGPVWVACLRREWATLYRPALMRPLICAALVAAAAFLVLNYRNPHPWNEDLWDLKNWPLVGMADFWSIRVVGAVLIVTTVPLVVRFMWLQPQRRMLAVVWLFSVLFLLPQFLAEPRYYIVPVVLLNLFIRLPAGQMRSLGIWYGALSVATAAVACIWGNAAGGVR